MIASENVMEPTCTSTSVSSCSATAASKVPDDACSARVAGKKPDMPEPQPDCVKHLRTVYIANGIYGSMDHENLSTVVAQACLIPLLQFWS